MVDKATLETAATQPNTIGRGDVSNIVHPDLVETIVALAKPAESELSVAEVTRSHFTDTMLKIPQSAFATIGFLTTAKDSELVCPKKNGISGAVQKLGVCQLVINANYAKMVNKRMGEQCDEGETIEKHFGSEFQAAEHPWADRVMVDGKPVGLVAHRKTGVLYLVSALLRPIGTTYYYLHGEPIEFGEISHLFHPKKESKRQPLPEERKVKWRTWKMESVRTVAITPNTTPRVCSRFILTD